MLKRVIRNLIFGTLCGVALGSFLTVAHAVIFDLTGTQHFTENFTVNALRIILVSVGFFISGAVIYETERFRTGAKLIIHIIAGSSVFLIVGFATAWFSLENYGVIVVRMGYNLLVMLAVWLGFYFLDKNEVRKINEKLRGRGCI